MSIVTLNQISLHVGGQCILDAADWHIHAHDRIALVGRNGAGKSSLLKLLQNEFVPDKGVISKLSGLRIAGLMQDVPFSTTAPVYHFLVKGLGELAPVLSSFYQASRTGDSDELSRAQQQMDAMHAWDVMPRIEMMASRLSVDPDACMSALSGGMKRRALLAAALIAAPDLLLLDEPTNHLDVDTIEWLESYLKTYHGALVVVTHDRTFLSEVATSIVEIDRGKLYDYACDYETYLDRREARRLQENKEHALFDKRLELEETWIRTGIKARRTRNEGRVRALKAMRETHRNRKIQMGKMNAINLEANRSGELVFDVQHLHYSVAEKTLIRDLSLLVVRGDKIGIIGPNGCGKTSLLRLLLKDLKPDNGQVKQGTSLTIAYFDQLREQLQDEQTVMANVADGADYVTINGKDKHVASYLKEFLFSPERFNQPVATLSGGEKNRLLLAKLLAKPVNLLVMDEPTNDLDIETLDLLETLLIDYPGTVLLISHDRAFVNQVVSSVLVFEGEGRVNEYSGSYEEYRCHKKQQREQSNKPTKTIVRDTTKLSFNEQRELALLPQTIEALEAQITALQEKMAAPDFYQQTAEQISQFAEQLRGDEETLQTYYQRWEHLEERS